MKLRIYFANHQMTEHTGYVLCLLVRRAIKTTLEYEHFDHSCEVSVTFGDDDYIHELNLIHRSIDAPTDVLSFPLMGAAPSGFEDNTDSAVTPLGDIVLSLERARVQAMEYGHSFEREVAFLTVHSTLHLLGYDHETSDYDDADMRRRQRKIMELMGLLISE